MMIQKNNMNEITQHNHKLKTSKMKITFLKTFTFVFLLSFFAQIGFPLSAFAATAEEKKDKIIVKWDDSSGDPIGNDKLFDANNIYPGWSESKTIYIKNRSEYDTDLYFKFNVTGNKKLAKELKLYVTRLGNNKSVLIGGPNDRYTLASADEEKNILLDELNSGSSERYRIKIKFDKNAGNEFQGLSTNFNVKFKIEEIISTNQTIGEIRASQNRPVVIPENLTDEQVEASEVEVLGENTPTVSNKGAETDSTGIVKGISKDCKNTNKNPWLLALAVLATIVAINGWKDSKIKGYGWKLDALTVGNLLIGWYLLESCHLLRWVPISAILIGIIFHFFSPYVFESKEGIK
jgi:hypothetical protein